MSLLTLLRYAGGETIESVWRSKVFENAGIAAISPNVLFFEHTEESEAELEDLYFDQEVNFFECVVTKTEVPVVTQGLEQRILVEVRYSREKDVSGANWRAVRNAGETLLSTIREQLGEDWDGTIDYYQPPEEPPPVQSGEVRGTKVWQQIFRFSAVNTVEL